MCGASGCGAVHPDHIITECIQVDHNIRYEVYSDSAYILEAKFSPGLTSGNMAGMLFTVEEPDSVTGKEDDDLLWPFSSTNGKESDEKVFVPGLYAKHGIYFEMQGHVPSAFGFLVVRFVKRSEYCCAFADPSAYLQDCWENAPGRAGTPLWENFDRGEEGSTPWADSGTEGSGFGGDTLTTEVAKLPLFDANLNHITDNGGT